MKMVGSVWIFNTIQLIINQLQVHLQQKIDKISIWKNTYKFAIGSNWILQSHSYSN